MAKPECQRSEEAARCVRCVTGYGLLWGVFWLKTPQGKPLNGSEPKLPLQSPFVSMAVTDAGVEERDVVAEVFSRAGLGTPSMLLAAERPVGRARGLLWPCRLCPQMRWCLSQSLCWQKEPQ